MDEIDASYLEYLLSNHAVDDAMDNYDENPDGTLHEILVWANDALDRYGNMIEAMFYPELWVM